MILLKAEPGGDAIELLIASYTHKHTHTHTRMYVYAYRATTAVQTPKQKEKLRDQARGATRGATRRATRRRRCATSVARKDTSRRIAEDEKVASSVERPVT